MKAQYKLSFLFFVFCLVGFAQPREVKTGWNLFSKEQDVQLGREAAAQLERQAPIVNDRTLNDLVNRIGKRLVSTGEAGDYPYTFKVVNDQNINAFALPGGPTYIHTGLIRAAENEAQLAGVMAHEIAHVRMRHGTEQASKQNLIQLPAMIAGGLIGGGSLLGQLAQLGIGIGANSVLLKYSRDAEVEADVVGARMMAKAGYNPMEMARFFEKLEAQGGSRGPQFLSSHPDPGDRSKIVQNEIRYLPQANYAQQTGLFQDAKSRIGSLPAAQTGTRSRTASSPGDVAPSSRFRTFNGASFQMSYPENWQVYGDQQGNSVTIAPQAGIAQDERGQTQIAYGMIASYYYPRNERVDLRQDTNDLIYELRRSNPSLQMGNQRSRQINVDGRQALVTELYSQSPYRGETEHDTLITVSTPNGLFYALFIAPSSAAHQFNETFERMLDSINLR
jgi:hypothetical protein